MSDVDNQDPRDIPGLISAMDRDGYRHCEHAEGRDVGGVLVGELNPEGPPTVDGTVRGDAKPRGRGERFPYGCWAELCSEVERRYPGRRIVGWYGRREGTGLRLSERDRSVHRRLFGGPGQIAVLVDSAAAQAAVFRWRGQTLVEHQRMSCGTPDSSGRSSPPRRTRAPRPRATPRRFVVHPADVIDATEHGQRSRLETALYLCAIVVSLMIITWDVLLR